MNHLIIDMIKTLISHLTRRERSELYDQLEVTSRYDLPENVEIVRSSNNYRVFGAIDDDEQDIHREMSEYLNNEGYDVIDWDNADDVIRVAAILEKDIDGYYVFTHQEDAGHLDEMARMLRESAYMHTSPMYNRLQSAGIYHGHQQLHELLAHDGMMILPTVDRYLEDPTGSDMWESDFRDALDHFWSGRGSEDHAEKVKFVMQWLADQV